MLNHFSHVQLFAIPARLLCPGRSLGKNTEVGCHFPLQDLKLRQSYMSIKLKK